VAGRSYRELVAERRPDALAPGPVETADGDVVGRHDGVAGFTVGQRRGLGLGGGGDVRHVVQIDAAARRLVVGPASALERHRLVVDAVRWWGPPPTAPIRVRVQIRHRQAAVPATVAPDGVRAFVRLAAPVRGVAPGQVAAFYDEADEVLVGAGTLVASTADVDVDAQPAASAAGASDNRR
jgi:tRNA-specific 2-thiouridylase